MATLTNSPLGAREIRVLALTKYGRRAASSRHRFLDYIPLLAQRGVLVTPAPLLRDSYVENLYAGRKATIADIAQAFANRLARLSSIHRFDVLWIEGELFPRLPAVVERALALLGRPYVIDLDDAIFHTYDLHPYAFVRRFLGHKVDVVLRGATAVLAGNDYLAERAIRAGARRVVVVPPTLDPHAYPQAEHGKNDPLIFGWIGSPATEHYLQTIQNELEALLRTLPAKLYLIGASPGTRPLAGAVYRTWTEESEGAELAACDLGLAPLFEGPWERGKCAIKAIQYMAAGLPVLAANVGALRSVVVDGETGFLYRNGGEFDALARRLAADRDLRLRMGRAGRQRAIDHYAIQSWADTVAEILKDCCRRPGQ
jgi:glycosyltransferase involved in cell wall biosynthesis